MMVDSGGKEDAWIVAEQRLVSERNQDNYKGE